MPPGSTYRVQVQPAFDLYAAAGIADYLADLGVTHFYSSPLLQAAPGSTHGYDVVDFSRVSADLGGEAARRRLVTALRAAGLALLVDIVPNHSGVRVPAANRAWWDVLRHGPESPYVAWFDIDWPAGRLVLPVLDDRPDALDHLEVYGDELHYHEQRFPLADGTAGGTPREVHDRQHYRLVSWRRADTELNYRRFFAVNDLAGLRVEDPAVFDAVHREVLRWYAAGDLAGIRVDHPDGLRDPTGYFVRLADRAPDAWLVAEKILEPGEDLPDWPVAGTTGYDALREVCGLFIDPAGEAAFTRLNGELVGGVGPAAVGEGAGAGAAGAGEPNGGDAAGSFALLTPGASTPRVSAAADAWAELAFRCKREVAFGMLTAERRRLAALVPEVPDAAEALGELLASFEVYRSYLPEGAEHLRHALSVAGQRRPDLLPALAVLGPRLADPADELAQRFQQTSGAVLAKGIEDSAFYRWSRFVALNEVGGDPSRFGIPVADFHAACTRRQAEWPYGMTTLSTHDTKRGEDVRARMAVLSELPDRWSQAVRRWLAAVPMPDPAYGHLLWQTLVGAWPIERSRLHAYAIKAGREGRVWTSWEDPDEAAETALAAAIDRIYDEPDLRRSVDLFAGSITGVGWSNALGQKLVQLTMPGVPDTYQGCEVWDNSLVDPDNRRPVDFASRRTLLARLDTGWLPPVDAGGAVKLLVTSRALRLRRDAPERFTDYHPRYADGDAADHIVAFDRGGAITVATRLPLGLRRRTGGWSETVLPLPDGAWTDVLTGGEYRGAARLADLLNRYPVALLRSDPA